MFGRRITLLGAPKGNRFQAGGSSALPIFRNRLAGRSSVARNQIETVLTRLGLNFIGTKTGKEAWDRLNILAHQARKAGVPMRDKVAMVLTDLEMPEMDGFTLTRQMKEDDVLRAVPVVIHSSLSGSANESHQPGGGRMAT